MRKEEAIEIATKYLDEKSFDEILDVLIVASAVRQVSFYNDAIVHITHNEAEKILSNKYFDVCMDYFDEKELAHMLSLVSGIEDNLIKIFFDPNTTFDMSYFIVEVLVALKGKGVNKEIFYRMGNEWGGKPRSTILNRALALLEPYVS